jgi:Rap1a immunity proteins
MTKMTLIAALTLAVLTTEATAQSSSSTTKEQEGQGYATADMLYEWCQQEPAKALYYVSGALDALMMNTKNLPMCIPAGSTVAQARDIVCNYLRDNPAKRHYHPASLVWHAQSQAWPCKK